VNEQGNGGPHVLALDGGQAIVEFDGGGAKLTRHELPNNIEQAGGFLRTTTDAAGHRYIAASGVGWQKVHIFDDAWKPVLAFPKERNPGIADIQIAAYGHSGQPRLYVGYWGGVGVQGVGLDGRRKWSERSLEQVVQLALVRKEADLPSTPPETWCTSNRGTILVLDAQGKPQREFAVGLRALMHVAVAHVDGALQCCGLALESVGHYQAVGFSPDGEVAWQYRLPPGEYVHQVERIQHVALPGGKAAWMIAAANGTIGWLDHEGIMLDQFIYGEPITGLTMTTKADPAILLVSTPEKLTAWKLTASKP
jgi:hypothetical protein